VVVVERAALAEQVVLAEAEQEFRFLVRTLEQPTQAAVVVVITTILLLLVALEL
jgi:hypothetical protein